MPAVGDTYSLRANETVTIRTLEPELLELQAAWAPSRGRPPRHHHPLQDERFVVQEGELTFELGRERRVARAGEEVEIPRLTVHRVWNSGAAPARATWQVRPALRTAELFATIDGGLNPAKAARVLWEFRDEFRLATSLRG